MSFFFKSSPRAKPGPAELARATKESFLALDTTTFAKVIRKFRTDAMRDIRSENYYRQLFHALEEVEKNILSMRQMLSGDGETEPNQDNISQLAVELCKGDVLALFIHKLPTLGWEARKDLVHCWSILLRQNIDSRYCCVEYLETHLELLDFLVVCYNNKEIALNCGNMLRECIKYPTLAKCILESNSFELFFKYVELPTFDIASDALATFKELLTKHETIVSQFLCSHYEQFFDPYEKLLTSPNYVTRRQSLKILSDFLLEPQNSQTMKRYILEVRYLKIMMVLLKDSSKNIQISAFHIFKATMRIDVVLDKVVFVANPNKPQEVVDILVDNHEELLTSLQKLPVSKGDDDQIEEEKDLIIQEIERISTVPKTKA